MFQKVKILVNCRAAQIAHPRQLAQIELPSLKRGVMSQKTRRNLVNGGLRSADLRSLGFGICHAGTDTLADDPKLQLRKHAGHLEEGVGHRINLALGAVHGEAANDLQAEPFGADDLDDLAELFGGASQSGNLQRDNSVSRLGGFQKRRKHYLLQIMQV